MLGLGVLSGVLGVVVGGNKMGMQQKVEGMNKMMIFMLVTTAPA